MKDEKEINAANKDEEALESTLNKSENYNQEQLNDELQKLAETFRAELKKAKEQGEVRVSSNEVVDENDNVIPKEELCECCGERRKDKSVSEKYAYCTDCRELMKRYPLNFSGIVVAVAVIIVAILGISGFVSDFTGYNTAKLAKDADRENKKYTAVGYYVDSASFFEEKGIVPKILYRESAGNIFSTLPQGVRSFYEVSEVIELAITDFEAKLPLYKGYVDLRNQSLTMYETFNAFYAIMNNVEYSEGLESGDKKTIETVYNEIGALVGKEFTIKSISGDDITVYYDEASVLFAQFMVAYAYSDYDKAYTALKTLDELAPEFITMYGYELAIIELQYGNYKEADSIAKRIMLNNAEDSSPYTIYSYSSRMQGKYEKAINQADKGLELDSSNSDLYRQKAIALLLKDEKEDALKVIEQGAELGEYAVLYCTYLVIANEVGDTEKVEEIKKILSDAEVDIPEKVQRYLDGKLSAEKLFTEGTGDIE